MARKPDDPDRARAPDGIDSLDVDALRALLARDDAAELFDADTRARIGRTIARAARHPPPPPPQSVPQQQQMQQQEQRPPSEEGESEGENKD